MAVSPWRKKLQNLAHALDWTRLIDDIDIEMANNTTVFLLSMETLLD